MSIYDRTVVVLIDIEAETLEHYWIPGNFSELDKCYYTALSDYSKGEELLSKLTPLYCVSILEIIKFAQNSDPENDIYYCEIIINGEY